MFFTALDIIKCKCIKSIQLTDLQASGYSEFKWHVKRFKLSVIFLSGFYYTGHVSCNTKQYYLAYTVNMLQYVTLEIC